MEAPGDAPESTFPRITETLLLRGTQWKYSSRQFKSYGSSNKRDCTQSLNLFSLLSLPSEKIPPNLMSCIAKTTHWTGNWWSKQSGGWRSERGGVRWKGDWVGLRFTGSRLTGRGNYLVCGQVESESRCRRPRWSHEVVMAGLFTLGLWGESSELAELEGL